MAGPAAVSTVVTSAGSGVGRLRAGRRTWARAGRVQVGSSSQPLFLLWWCGLYGGCKLDG